MIDQILQRVGLKYEDLNSLERETLLQWSEGLTQNTITIHHVKNYISQMKDGVERELTTTEHNSKQDIFLKARLRNYMLLEAYLQSPEKAKEALDRALAGITPNKKS